MNKNAFKAVKLEKGEMHIYDVGGVRLHAYKTNDFIDDEVFIVEKNGKAVIIESPCFFDNSKELTEYLKDVRVEGMLIAYHGAGATFMPQVPKYATKNAVAYSENGGGKALIDKFAGAFGEIFDSSVHQITNVIDEGKLTIGGMDFIIKQTGDAFDVEIPEINAVYTHMLGHDCHSIVAGAGQMCIRDSVDIVLLVLDGNAEVTPPERALLDACAARGVTCLLVRNKSDQYPQHADGDGAFWVSAKTGENISALRERIASLAQAEPPRPPIIADLLAPGDLVVLVTPIDASAPKGRLILPQQQTIRDILDAGGQALVTKEDALEQAFSRLRERPRMVVTDSQAFEQVAAVTPQDVPLTSFSILFARHGGVLKPVSYTHLKVCPSDAIVVEDNIAHIDPEKCTNCGLCAEKDVYKRQNSIQEETV